MTSTPFRTLFLLRSSFDHVEVIPLAGDVPTRKAPLGGVLEGREALESFIGDIGFDSLVESYQVADPPTTSFLYTFHLTLSPERMMEILTARSVPSVREFHRVLELSDDSAPEQLSLSPLEAFQLGASKLSASDGLSRVAAWFDAQRS